MNKYKDLRILFVVITALVIIANLRAGDKYTEILKEELDREMDILSKQDPPVYYMNYRVDYYKNWEINADFGNIFNNQYDEYAILTTDIRVGDATFDNTHLSKGEADNTRKNSVIIPYDNNSQAIKQYIWRATDEVYRKARAAYLAKKNKISVEETEKYDDFSPGAGEIYFEPAIDFEIDKKFENKITGILKEASAMFPKNTETMNGSVFFQCKIVRKYFVSSEGHEIVQNIAQSRILIRATVRDPEGGPIQLVQPFYANLPDDLPDKETVISEAKSLYDKLLQLRDAPLAEPYSGPAILSDQASGVFFHEILGHRVEGHRLKDETDAHTFKLKINQNVLPKTMSVVFDPTLSEINGIPLYGYYKYDDEGTRASRVEVIKNGVLKDFLMSNTPVPGYAESNGHGRAQSGFSAVSRQSNLFVTTIKPYTEEELRKKLIKDCKREGKEYGYYFKKVQGGFTLNKRYMPNAFNVFPTEVYRIYVDGREDELVRGVKLIGTPLAMFSNIEAAGDQPGVFTGTCGAESGGVPVAAISPSIYVSKIETQKNNQFYSTGPILESPQINLIVK